MTPTTTVDHQTTSKRRSSPKQQFRHHGDGTVFVTSLRHQLQFLTKPNVIPQKPPALLEVSPKQLSVLFTEDEDLSSRLTSMVLGFEPIIRAGTCESLGEEIDDEPLSLRRKGSR
jgi:hypothetical protein